MNRTKQVGSGLIALAVIALMAGCEAREAARMAHTSSPMLQDEAKTASGGAPAANAPAAPGGVFANKETGKTPKLTTVADSAPDRYLIKNATVTVEAGDVKQATAKLIADAKALKGYVSDMHETVDSLGSRSVTVQVRIPAQEFDNFLQQFDGRGKVLEKQVTTQDVTEEFVDSQSRLRNLKATEARLLDHLHRSGKLSDTLLVETELTRVREEIEQLEGRLRFLAHRVDYSTLSVTLKEAAHVQALTPPESYSSGQVASEAMRSLVGFGQAVWTLVIWVALWSVVWLPPLLVAYYIVWRKRKHRGQRFDIPPVP